MYPWFKFLLCQLNSARPWRQEISFVTLPMPTNKAELKYNSTVYCTSNVHYVRNIVEYTLSMLKSMLVFKKSQDWKHNRQPIRSYVRISFVNQHWYQLGIFLNIRPEIVWCDRKCMLFPMCLIMLCNTCRGLRPLYRYERHLNKVCLRFINIGIANVLNLGNRHTWMHGCIFSCDETALTPLMSALPSVCTSVWMSVHLWSLCHSVPVITSSCNLQELSPLIKVMSMQKVKGQRSRSQKSK